MTPFEIALAIRNRADQDEDIKTFALRTMPGEKMADLGAAVSIIIGWVRADEEVEKLCAAVSDVAKKAPDAKIEALVAEKRRLGYDPALETLLARRWRCPHCKQFSNINNVEMPIGDPERLLRCMICGEEGIAPVDTEAHLDVRDGGKSGLQPTSLFHTERGHR